MLQLLAEDAVVKENVIFCFSFDILGFECMYVMSIFFKLYLNVFYLNVGYEMF